MDSLRAGDDASPPRNMRKAIIFNGAMVAFASAIVCIGFRGKQSRREMDTEMYKEAKEIHEEHPGSVAEVPASSKL